MKQAIFAPGFRLSIVDACVLVTGTVAAVILSATVWWWGFVLAFVLGHFFLFCNVVRISRRLELAWAAIFVVLAVSTVAFETPGWLATALASLLVTVGVIFIEMRKPSYRGVGWQWINPGLPIWWEAHVAQKGSS